MTRMFVRVRDKDTGHEYDVREDAIRPGHEVLADRGVSPRPRRAKHRVPLGGHTTSTMPRRRGENQEG